MALRVSQLGFGLVLYGFGFGLLINARLGLDPWDVLNQGLSRRFGLGIGTWAIIVGVIVLGAWIPLRQLPGIGTVANVAIIGNVINVAVVVLPKPVTLDVRIVYMVAAVAIAGIATGLYIGSGLGPGPRDGLMTGMARRGHSLRVVRTVIEGSVLLLGWILGGTVGVGTVLYAASLGPLSHVLIPLFSRGRVSTRPDCGLQTDEQV
ncbi:MAG: YczE/YyaS/YitT family protein [Acidimicrobiales bacterium]